MNVSFGGRFGSGWIDIDRLNSAQQKHPGRLAQPKLYLEPK